MTMTSTLYVTRTGLLEPLGQSQVMAYLRGLSRDYRITLITCEKPADWSDEAAMIAARAECEALGIRWLPQRFRPRPKLIAPALSMAQMAWLGWREVRRDNIRLIHARSYPPAVVALLVGGVTGVPFIFDMRALWPEELISGGHMRRGSMLHRAIVAAEKACLQRSGAVVSLTHAAVVHLRQIYPNALEDKTVAVIPTCADLNRFRPADGYRKEKIIGCLGTLISSWFRLDWLGSFLAVAARRNPELRFELTTRDDPEKVRAALGGGEELQAKLAIAPANSAQVPAVLQSQIASVMFFTNGVSKLGSSPTRMAEILGCGLPVVANEGIGDIAHIIRRYRVGVLAAGPSPEQMETAYDELQALLADPELAVRCRQAAEEVFSLEAGTDAYRALYRTVLDVTSCNAGASDEARLHEHRLKTR